MTTSISSQYIEGRTYIDKYTVILHKILQNIISKSEQKKIMLKRQ